MSRTAQIKWKLGEADAVLVEKIGLRAHRLAERLGMDTDILSPIMDVTACHLNGCPLKLAELLAATQEEFAHDVFGIGRHLDRRNGKLTDCFLPRFAAPAEKDEVAA